MVACGLPSVAKTPLVAYWRSWHPDVKTIVPLSGIQSGDALNACVEEYGDLDLPPRSAADLPQASHALLTLPAIVTIIWHHLATSMHEWLRKAVAPGQVH